MWFKKLSIPNDDLKSPRILTVFGAYHQAIENDFWKFCFLINSINNFVFLFDFKIKIIYANNSIAFKFYKSSNQKLYSKVIYKKLYSKVMYKSSIQKSYMQKVLFKSYIQKLYSKVLYKSSVQKFKCLNSTQWVQT